MLDWQNKTCDGAILALAQGDSGALSVIYEAMARMIFSVALAMVNSYQDAEDVLQETLVQVTRSAHTYQGGSNAKAWIMAITRHTAVNMIRKRKYTQPQAMEMENCQGCHQELSRLEIFDLLAGLEEEERQVVVFRLYSQLPYKDIAQVMDITLAAAQKKYQRAIAKLKVMYFEGGKPNVYQKGEGKPKAVR